jgi:ribosome-binding protein aMBF1 (putative translation factor)
MDDKYTMPEITRRKMDEQLQNQFNMMKRAEEAATYETDTLAQKLQEEASYIKPEEKERLDKLYEEIENKNSHTELSTEVKEALSSIFSEGE